MKPPAPVKPQILAPAAVDAPSGQGAADDFLKALGDRIRLLRARRGMSRKMLADAADVSLRYLSDLENGSGNASVLLLRQVARALDVPIEEIVNETGERSIELVLLTQALRALPEDQLAAARVALNQFLHPEVSSSQRAARIALIGLRGAGKTTLGKRLAALLDVPFVELNKEIERSAGMVVGEIHSLYGQSGYRRYERQCLDAILERYPRVVLATPGSIVAETATFNHLLAHFYTVWLRATPEDHMGRVVAQGDMRPIAGHGEAMADLKRILEGRVPFYSKADLSIDTSSQDEAATAEALRKLLAEAR